MTRKPRNHARRSNGLRFGRVRLENWRNFGSVDVDLAQRVFLVGPNASGKSNFLDAFRFLHDIVAVGGGLEEAVRKRQGISKLRSLYARKVSDILISVDVIELADADRFSTFFAVRRAAIPDAPEAILDPKHTVVALGSASRRKSIRDDVTPRPGSGREVGPAYTSRLIEFASHASEGWRPNAAAQRAPSLARCLARLEHVVQHGPPGT
jgi:putative AbiEii toxin of type IV toxin-antitoxin system